MRTNRLLLILVCVAALTPSQSRLARTDWKSIRGVNYIASYGRNLYEIWRNYNHDAFDSELALAEDVGYNSVRIWLNYFAYAENPQKFSDSVADAVALCRKHHLRVLMVLFDSCGIRPRPGSRPVKVLDAYNAFLRDSKFSGKTRERIRSTYRPYAEGPGRDVLVPLAAGTPPEILLWQYWQPSPGFDKMDEAWWPKLDEYLAAVTERLANDSTVLAWDLMNEPEFASEDPFENGMADAAVRDKVERLLKHEREFIKQKHPDQLLTVGFAALDDSVHYEALADVVTFHVYGNPERIASAVEKANAFSIKTGKPVFISETLANFSFPPYDVAELATDQGQLNHYRKIVPVLLQSNMGWMAWGLVVGRLFDSYTDIFYANGHPRPAAVYLREMLRQGQ